MTDTLRPFDIQKNLRNSGTIFELPEGVFSSENLGYPPFRRFVKKSILFGKQFKEERNEMIEQFNENLLWTLYLSKQLVKIKITSVNSKLKGYGWELNKIIELKNITNCKMEDIFQKKISDDGICYDAETSKINRMLSHLGAFSLSLRKRILNHFFKFERQN